MISLQHSIVNKISLLDHLGSIIGRRDEYGIATKPTSSLSKSLACVANKMTVIAKVEAENRFYG